MGKDGAPPRLNKKTMKTTILLTLAVALLALAARPLATPATVDENTPVHEVLMALGAPERADVKVRPAAGGTVELGRQIVTENTLSDGDDQSNHFTCTACHNLVREDPVLNAPDPEARLDYAVRNNLPFLPGTTLWGAVNRETYYNGDYDKKYGDLVKNARNNLRGAIQLCAVECAQGEALTDEEMESVVAFLHTIGLKVSDLPEDAPSVEAINRAIAAGGDNDGVIKQLKRSYNLASPATFVLPPEDRKAGFPVAGTDNPANGKEIYERACLHCHQDQRYSFFELASNEFHYAFMTKHFPKYTRYSTYQVTRYGTSPIPGKRAYMPHYTAERMSDRQIEDLRAYLNQAAK